MTRPSEPSSSSGVDCHVHLFRHDLALAAQRRYAPDYDAGADDLLAAMRANGLGRAIVVQPSFLGTDNSHLLETIARAPARFAGVAVVEPDIGEAELAILKRGGIVGIRFNCIGARLPALASPLFLRLADRLAAADLVLEIQAEMEQWQTLAPALPDLPCRVVVDHFGRTAPGHPSRGFELLLDAASRTERIWYKFSAPYRLPAGAALQAADAILAVTGPGRIVWGSDWPWTQYEGRHTYRETLDWLSAWIPDAETRKTILMPNASRLFRAWAEAADAPAQAIKRGA